MVKQAQPELWRSGTGVYGYREASRLTGVPVQTIYRWCSGRSDKKSKSGVFQPSIPSIDGRHAISFLDLIELLIVGRLRDEGVSLQRIRPIHDRLRTLLDVAHPFSHNRLFTDGRSVFLNSAPPDDEEYLEDLFSHQRAFPAVLTDYLNEIDFNADTHIAEQWRLSDGVVLDPKRCFGKPIVSGAGISTFILAESYWANDRNLDLVADIFNIDPELVRKAVDFESAFAA